MRRTRFAFAALAAAGAYSGSALGVAGAASTARIKFAFRQSPVPRDFHLPAANLGHAPVMECQWPDGKRSITVAAARRVTCFPKGSRLPDLTGSRWLLLESPIAGAKYPTLRGGLSDDIRLVHASRVPGLMDVSPVLMQFGDYSGGARPSIIVRGSSIWLYDYVTERGAQLLNVSTTTGKVLQRTSMPAISRPACTVNQYGFWMAQAPDSFFSERPRLGVWFAPTGARRGVLLRASNENVIAIGTAGATVELLAQRRSRGTSLPPRSLWRFSPTSA